MDKARIFIASSEKTIELARMLRDELDRPYCEATTWEDALELAGTQARIEALEQWVRKYDFAVIIFSQADMLAVNAGEELKSRYDCVFEAGLFMAANGRSRCFLLSSIEPSELPLDLGGINFFRFKEPKVLTDLQECRRAIQGPAGLMLPVIQNLMGRGVPNRPLTPAALLERQQLETDGELKEDQVVVASVQPPELGYKAAERVRRNIDSNISYVYFFYGNTDAADKIPQLLQLVLLVGLNEKDATTFRTRNDVVAAHRNEIIEALKDICLNDKLNIFFLEESRDLEFCIHNAGSHEDARLYLKHGNDFIHWASGPSAYGFWCAIRKKTGADDPKNPDAVFHGARDFNLAEGSFLRALRMGMRKYFPGFGDEVMQLCLEGPAVPARAGAA
jgi:hypothetical protein